MKIKSLLVGMLASAAFVACTNNDELEVINGNESAEKAYLAINLNYASTGSRAETEGTSTIPNFQVGSADENAVNNVSFFFFDADGNAYAVNGTSNRLDKGYEAEENGTGDVNVEETSKPILLIEKSKNVPPQKIVAVLNCPIEDTTISLSTLQGKVGAYNTITIKDGDKAGTYFVMSNSVYKNEVTGEAVVATDIPALSISPDADQAKANPVTIYVERVAAKVAVTANYAEDAESFATGVKTSEGTDIYAQITGWEVVNAKTQAPLLKGISTTWTYTWWNDATNFRSYWATNTADEDIIKSLNWNMTNPSHRYYYENTDIENVDNAETTQLEGNQSYLLVKAAFVDAEGESLAGKIAEWYGAKYTVDELKTQFANALATKIYYKTSATEAKSIKPEHITFYQESEEEDEKRYLCYAMLNPETTADNTETEEVDETVEFVKGVDENGDFIEFEEGEIEEILATIRPAKIWEAGGYYYLPIAHNSEVNGLVRNHVYQMNINGITGLGTPVYDPKKLITPEKPTEDESYISAEIKVLSWKVVSNDVILQ